MDEQKVTTQNSTENTAESNDEGIQQKTTSELDRADQIAERLKRENDRRESLLQREEALEARRRVGGLANAGQVEQKKPETDEEYFERFKRGEANPLKDDGVR